MSQPRRPSHNNNITSILWLLFLVPSQIEAQSNINPVSTDGSCSLISAGNSTCLTSSFGDCCSAKGFCGSTASYCGSGCQSAFGTCSANATEISADGSCGGTKGQICSGSTFGDCCSQNGFCGSGASYCGVGCQSQYGRCGGNSNSTSNSTTSSTSTSSSASITQATPIGATSTSSSSSSSSSSTPTTKTTGFKAGMAVMAVILVAIIAGVLAYFYLRRRKLQRDHHSIQGESFRHDASQLTENNSYASEMPSSNALQEVSGESEKHKEQDEVTYYHEMSNEK